MLKRRRPPKDRSDYLHVKAGEWIEVPWRNYMEQCCDCGLVHKLNFRLKNGKLEIQAFRHGPATGGARKNKIPLSSLHKDE